MVWNLVKPMNPHLKVLILLLLIAMSKIDDEKKFRKDMFKSKRKSMDEIWQGELISGVVKL